MNATWRISVFVAVTLATGASCSNPPIPDGGGDEFARAPLATDATSRQPREVGPTATDQLVQFTVSLRLPDEDAVAGFLRDLSDPDSPDFKRYLAPEEFGQRFGVSDAALQGVLGWLETGGLSASVVPQRTSIAVSGRAADVNGLLGVTLLDWSDETGTRYHRPDREPTIPGSVADAVASIVGLDTRPALAPASGRMLFSGVPGNGLVGSTVSRAYEIDPLHDAGFHGEGQAVAIISFDTFTPSDVDLFDERHGIDAPPVVAVRINGASDQPGSGTGEVALDIQVIRGIAPQAQIYNYEGPNTVGGFAPIMAQIVADGFAQVVSVSWGLCEKYYGEDEFRAEEREFAAAFAAGISVFIASGDDGAYDCRRVNFSGDPFARDHSQSARWPATSVSTIGVGGTFLSTREDGTYISEFGWEEPLTGSGTGGGLSVFAERPSWQQGVGVQNAESNGMRQVPDVSGPADPSSGFVVVYTEPGQGLVSGQIGGTSAAAPFWSAAMVLTEQMAASEGLTELGALAPTLYAISAEQPTGAVFHDILRGGNLLHDAGPGWDYSTGLGSPRVAPLARAVIDFLNR